MQDIDNHMDELFQKAAENYPLKINTGNFDDLVPFIGKASNTASTTVLLKGKRKIAFLLLALFFIALSAGTYFYSKTNEISDDKAVSKNSSTFSIQDKIAIQANVKTDVAETDNGVTEKMQQASENIFEKSPSGYNLKGKTITNILQPDAMNDDINTNQNIISVDKKDIINKSENKTPDQSAITATKINIQPENEIINEEATKKKYEIEEKKTAGNKKKKKPGFYYGIAAGIELNKVKNQGLSKAGFNAGVILGVQINKKVAIETGLQLSQKKYYSDGKYFKPKSGSMPANMTVKSLQSTATLIEIPLSIKYNFSKKRNTLYAKAGLSSYIITKESNKYQAVVNGQQQEINSTYTANKGYLISDVRFSAGYQQSVNKKLKMRVEPYLQIPIKGIGIGALPVTTAGLQIVLTRN